MKPFSFLLLSLASLMVAKTAAAQVVGVAVAQATVVQKTSTDQDLPTDQHPSGIPSYFVNREDCIDDNVIVIPLTQTGIPNASYKLQAWAGTGDCKAIADRTSTTATCWPVLGEDVPQVAQSNIRIRVRDLLSHISDNPKPVVYSSAGADVCDAQTVTGATALTVSFLWLDGSNNVVSSDSFANIKLDTKGPSAPTGLALGVDDSRLAATWTPSTDGDAVGYRMFCTPVLGGGDDAGTGTDAETTALGVSECSADSGGTVCASNPFGLGTVTGDASTSSSVIASEYACGTVGSRETASFSIEGLTNGKKYHIAIASTDSFGNVGAATTPKCDCPTITLDFWNAYKGAGGQAGNGCAVSTANVAGVQSESTSVPVSTYVGIMTGALVFSTTVRRRSRKDAKKNGVSR